MLYPLMVADIINVMCKSDSTNYQRDHVRVVRHHESVDKLTPIYP